MDVLEGVDAPYFRLSSVEAGASAFEGEVGWNPDM